MEVKRQAHVLKPNLGTELPRRWIFYDCESYQDKSQPGVTKHTLRLGWACYSRIREFEPFDVDDEWFMFRTPKEFWDWVETKLHDKTRTFLVSHNQHFDFVITHGFSQLKKRKWELRNWIIDTERFIVSFQKGKRYLEVVDSLNIFKSSIEELGNVLGLPKLHVDYLECTDDELSTYCKRDVEILRGTMLNWLRFLHKYDLGTFRPTIAGQAFNTFRHKFMHTPIYIHNNPTALEIERESYRGGRCEAFYIGIVDQPVYYLDVNSMYPYVMRHYSYPVKLIKTGYGCTLEQLRRYIGQFCVIARVKLKTDEPVYGVKRERLIFPIGTFLATLCTRELEYALQHNHLVEVYDYALYQKAPIFGDYVDFFHRLKTEAEKRGDKVERMNAKYMLNSLYGKFGEKLEKVEKFGETDSERIAVSEYVDEEKGYVGLLIQFGGKIYLRKKEAVEPENSFPAISSEVTANARMYLWKLMCKAGLDNVLYVDTDGLFVTQQGYENLKNEIDPHVLGKLKLEAQANGMVIYGAKDYIFGSTRKLKGVSKNAKKIGDNEWLCERWLKFRTLLRRGQLETPLVEEYVKQLKREYLKGVVTETGRVKPLVLSE